MCTIDYDSQVKVYREDPRTARKEHSCVGCGAAIHKGEAYCYVSWVGDTTARSEQECFACWWTRREFCLAHWGGPLPSFLWEDLEECIDGERSNPWQPHLAALKRRWRVSWSGRKSLAAGWWRRAITRQLRLTRRIVRERADP